MGLTSYRAQVYEWEKKYGKPAFGAYRFNPCELKVACARCGKIKNKMSRHHKGSEFVFACMLPDVFAPRYIQFHKDDVVRLCDDCHKNIERYTEPLKELMWAQIRLEGVMIITREWCEMWIAEFRSAFDKWIASPRRGKSKKKHRRRSRV